MLAAESRAKATEADAEQRAKELVESAEQERARILEQLTTEKAALDAHLEGLIARRAEVLSGLSQLHEALGTTIGEVAPVPPADGQAFPPQEPDADIAGAGTAPHADPRPGDDQDADVTASNEIHASSGAAGGHDAGQPSEAVGAGSSPGSGSSPVTMGPMPTPPRRGTRTGPCCSTAKRSRTTTPPPPLPSFQRAGSQPDGSQRAGG